MVSLSLQKSLNHMTTLIKNTTLIILATFVILFTGYHYITILSLKKEIAKANMEVSKYKAIAANESYYRQADAQLLSDYQEALMLFRAYDSIQANRFEIIMEGLDINQ